MQADLVRTHALVDVINERFRQIEVEGWTAEHDDEHAPGEMARAGACYAEYAGLNDNLAEPDYREGEPPNTDHDAGSYPWPWDMRWWKPKSPRADLVRAAALILAEIEKIDRDAARAVA